MFFKCFFPQCLGNSDLLVLLTNLNSVLSAQAPSSPPAPDRGPTSDAHTPGGSSPEAKETPHVLNRTFRMHTLSHRYAKVLSSNFLSQGCAVKPDLYFVLTWSRVAKIADLKAHSASRRELVHRLFVMRLTALDLT